MLTNLSIFNIKIMIAILLMSVPIAYGQHGGGGSGGKEDEGPGANLSFPNIFSEGVGLAGSVIDPADPTTTGLREVPVPPGYDLSGGFWYVWGSEETPSVCNPAADPLNCPPDPLPSDLRRAYLQSSANNSWQADYEVAKDLTEISTVDWGDNIESHAWSTKQRQIRVEVGLTKTLVAPMVGDTMVYLAGKGQTETWGVSSPDKLPGIPDIYDSSEATIFSPCSRLTIQKLYRDAGNPEALPADDFTWDAANGEWKGPTYTVFNGSVWEGFGSEGPTVKFAAEINVKGKLVYGFNWKINDMVLAPSYRKVGWYRLTFSLDGSAADGKNCGDYSLNTSMLNAVLAVSEEEGSDSKEMEVSAEEEEEPKGFTAKIDKTNNLTYIDIYLAAGLGESVDNHQPVCEAGNAYSLLCSGITTNVFLSADGSYDPDGDPLSYSWSHNCVDGVINDSTIQNPVMSLIQPGAGNLQNCTVSLKVTELDLSNPLSAECSAAVSVLPCPLDCFDTPFGQAQLDLCGKCGGTNECFDCAGQPFGSSKIDRCGLCGGDGSSCLGCTQSQSAPVLSQLRLKTRNQQRLVKSAVAKLRSITHNKKYAQNKLTLVNRLIASNNTLYSTIGTLVNSCTNSKYCVRQDNSSSIKDFTRNINKINYVLNLLTKDLSAHRYGRFGQSLVNRGKLLLKQMKKDALAVPATQDVCY